MADPLLHVEQLEVVYHRVLTAVQGVSLEVGKGRIVALLGTNGAGKTTTLRAISGFIGMDDARVTAGRVLYQDADLKGLAPHRVTARGIVLVPEREKVFENLTVSENLQVPCVAPAAESRRMQERAFEYFPVLARLKEREAGLLSGGERQMLAIASALMCAPELLLVDELSLGLAPRIVEEIMRTLQSIRGELGMTILLVEQNAAVALDIADHGYIMENGRIVLDGDPQRLYGHDDIQEFYLGSTKGTRRSYRDVKQYRRSRRWYG